MNKLSKEPQGNEANTLLVAGATTKNKYLALKLREHLNAVGYSLSEDTESLIRQVLDIDGKYYDENFGTCH